MSPSDQHNAALLPMLRIITEHAATEPGQWVVLESLCLGIGKLHGRTPRQTAEKDKARIKAILRKWFRSGALATEHRRDGKGNDRPFVIVGNPVSPSEIGRPPHPEKWGGESGEGGENDPR